MAYNLESLLKILRQILHTHPRIQLDSEQKLLLESLLEKVNFLNQGFQNPTWGLTTHGIEDLERRITDAAHDAEDVIESHLANHLLLTSEDLLLLCSDIHIGSYCIDQLFSTPNDAEDVVQSHLRVRDQILMICPLDLQRVIENFELIKEEITKMMDKIHTTPGPGASSSSSLPVSSLMGPNPHNIVVGINEDLLQLKHKLTNDYEKNLEVIPIVGMGGIGKTTLAQNLYNDRLIVYHFDMRAWTTISQAYDERRILLDLSKSILGKSADELKEIDNGNLALKLYQALYGWRYLIVLDDTWSSQDWHSMRRHFPDNHNGSRVIVTARERTVVNDVDRVHHHQMKFLHDEDSWDLLNRKVFGEETCPPELERIGHVIAQDCKGLPLAVDVISGILAQLPRTQEAWEEVARDVSLAVTNSDDNQFANIMLLSYNHLPCHLKPCFLYMAAFPEDFKIRTSKLVRLWVAEGFLKPTVQYESLEDVGKVYLKALADRNLILVSEQSKIKDNVKSYMLHDVMRELCIRKAQEENFLHINVQNQATGLSSFRRICEHGSSVIHVESGREIAILPRTFLLFHTDRFEWSGIWGLRLRLVRVLDMLRINFEKFPEAILKLINLRYLALNFGGMIPGPISVLCNLQTIWFDRLGYEWTAKEIFEIFMIPQLRHLTLIGWSVRFTIDREPRQSFTLQKDLQSLSCVQVSSSLQYLLKTTPNLKKLGITWWTFDEEINVLDLTCLSKLETLDCDSDLNRSLNGTLLSRVILPPSLKKLRLEYCRIKEEHFNEIAKLPNLQVLKLLCCEFVSEMWQPPEGGFDRLNYLLLRGVSNLKKWTADETHYPRLQHLIIGSCDKLEEIPTDLGNIPTLELIELEGDCTTSALESARKIQEEQLEMGNDGLEVRITNITTLRFVGTSFSPAILPPSVRNLILESCIIEEEHLNDIAMLPNLQVLKMVGCEFVSEMWEPPQGGFDSLNYLFLREVSNLKKWTADETHYPRLQHLTITDCDELEEIPTDLGNIPTLELIELKGMCRASVVECARKIQEELLKMGNDALQVRTTNIGIIPSLIMLPIAV